MTKAQIREAIMRSPVLRRLYVDYDTVNPDVITPSEVTELVEHIWEEYERSG